MCLGAMDGKHIVLQKPANSGSTFFNYKHTHSIVLLAVVDADYRFLIVDVGCQGRISDGGVFRNSSFCSALESNALNIPPPEAIPDTDTVTPFVFVADAAFPLTTNIMKPYAHRGLSQIERVYNYRLSRARRMSENVFGILVSRFRVFRAGMEVTPDKAKDIVLAAVVLHNFLMHRATTRCSNVQLHSIAPTDRPDMDECSTTSHNLGILRNIPPLLKRPTFNGKAVRNQFAEYFMTAGQVSWQWNIK